MADPKYVCSDCEWAAGSESRLKSPARQAIDHHAAYGHHVERVGERVRIRARGSRFQ